MSSTFTFGVEPRNDAKKLTKERNAEPLEYEFHDGDAVRRVREGIEAHKRRMQTMMPTRRRGES